VTAGDDPAELRLSQKRGPGGETLAQVLKVDHVTVLSTDEDQRAASASSGIRDEFPRRRPGVIMGYDRNVATNTMLRRAGIKSSPLMAANWAGAAVARGA